MSDLRTGDRVQVMSKFRLENFEIGVVEKLFPNNEALVEELIGVRFHNRPGLHWFGESDLVILNSRSLYVPDGAVK